MNNYIADMHRQNNTKTMVENWLCSHLVSVFFLLVYESVLKVYCPSPVTHQTPVVFYLNCPLQWRVFYCSSIQDWMGKRNMRWNIFWILDTEGDIHWKGYPGLENLGWNKRYSYIPPCQFHLKFPHPSSVLVNFQSNDSQDEGHILFYPTLDSPWQLIGNRKREALFGHTYLFSVIIIHWSWWVPSASSVGRSDSVCIALAGLCARGGNDDDAYKRWM